MEVFYKLSFYVCVPVPVYVHVCVLTLPVVPVAPSTLVFESFTNLEIADQARLLIRPVNPRNPPGSALPVLG